MDARLEADRVAPKSAETLGGPAASSWLGDIEMKSLLDAFNDMEFVKPTRETRATALGSTRPAEPPRRGTRVPESRTPAQPSLPDQLAVMLARRETLRSEIKRGTECLRQVQQELAKLQNQLEEWPAYERICGANPLVDHLEAIAARERVEKFLPAWLRRQERHLQVLDRKLMRCARRNRLEHLL
jgi:hypothetical protein